ncbi:MAG: FAD-dependent oxidoreductase [Desulfobacterales bacterium]|nr:FAD-dependent oxidoreductase [Desulfobacterales bacterium]
MQERIYKNLFTPIKIRGKELKNRIVMTPVQVNFSTDGNSNERYKEFFGLRAGSGASLIMVEPVLVDRTQDMRVLSLYEDRFLPRLAELVETIHSNGALTGIQLNHLGRQGDLILKDGDPPLVAPSPIPWSPRSTVPKELTQDEIKELVEKYADVAVRVKEAGFDLVEIHGAHGYLVSEFLSPLSNKRTDEYGGDEKGRARFAIEIIKRIRETLGNDFPISIRINGTDNISGGLVIDDTKAMAPLLVEGGADLISISAGANGSYPTIVPGYETSSACYVPFAEEVRSVVDVPVLGGGCIADLSLAEEIVADGKVDLVAMTRAFIADPEFIHKTLEGKTSEIRRCVRCNTCIDNSMYGSLICLANPEAGRETEFKLKSADIPKTVTIVGGGLAGMEAARICALRGHHVTLYEKGETLGGQWLLAAVPPHKDVFNSLIEYLTGQIQKLDVEVELGQEVTLSDMEEKGPDAVIIATGATALIPTIPGVDQAHVITAQEILRGYDKIGERVLVIGGGAMGLEVAELLMEKGKDVTVVEMLKKIGQGMGATIRWNLLNRLGKNGIKIFKSTMVNEISEKEVVITKNGNKETWEGFDTIVLAVGMESRNEIADEIKGKVKEVYVIGDALSPRRGVDAMREGAETGLRI